MSYIYCRESGLVAKLRAFLFSAGVQALLIYRISHFLHGFYFFRLLGLSTLFYRLNQLLCHVDIDPGAVIGQNFLMPHCGGVVIGATAVIGDNVTVMQNVTIGAQHFEQQALGLHRHAHVGDNVFIGPNALVLGGVKVATGSQIAAAAVLLRDTQLNETVKGVAK